MAKRKTKSRQTSLENLLRREQLKAKRLHAQFESAQLKAALSYYAAADKGRRNKDWKAPPASADLAIIPDSGVVASRSRHTVANTWVGKAAVRSQKRNVIGRGIETVAAAHDGTGKELADLNTLATRRFRRWADLFRFCDIESKRTYWQIQRTIVSEEFQTGVGIIAWSYQPNPQTVGLRLQLFEFEQLVREINTYGGNEVRGGVEIENNGAPVAMHFYRKPPNDYLGWDLKTVRITIDRLFVYFDAERVHQNGFMSQMAPVLQSIRDFGRWNGVTMDRAYMESCIGMVITRNSPVGTNGTPFGLPRAPGAQTTTATGMPLVDFTPGMTVVTQPGEDVKFNSPQTPGNAYEPFTVTTLRGIGAGIGQSLGSLTRHNDANYSAARQDMLEDEREIAPQQDALIAHVNMPIYELWYRLAVLEGRLPVDDAEFLADPERFIEAEYIPPARPWIDPEKEMNAWEKGINLRIVTRSEIVAMNGGTFKAKLRAIQREREDAAACNITFPEDAPKLPASTQSPQKQLPAPTDAAVGATNVDEGGGVSTESLVVTADAPPNYKPTLLPATRCGACKFFVEGKCTAYSGATVGEWFVCDSFETQPVDLTVTGKVIQPPPLQDGERGIDRDFQPAASTAPPI